MIEHLPEVKNICKTYNLLTNALKAKINTKEYNELKQQMSHDELSALKVLQQTRNTANYQTKRANGTNKKREKNRTPSEESQQENTHEHNSTTEDSLSESNQVENNKEHCQTEQKEEHTSTPEQIQSESNLTVLQEVEKQIDNDDVPENNTIEIEQDADEQIVCAYLTESINQ